MKVLRIDPGYSIRLDEIQNSLAGLQEAVGGHIETLTMEDGLVLICHEEGRLIGLTPSCVVRVRGVYEMICGTALICRVQGDELTDVTLSDVNAVRQYICPLQFRGGAS